MRILDIDPNNRQESINKARAIIKSELAHPGKLVIIVWGDSPAISDLADIVAARCDTVPWREAIWVRNKEIFDETMYNIIIREDAHKDECAVIFDFDDNPAEWLKTGLTARDVFMLLKKY